MTSFLPILLQPWFTNVVFQDAQLDLPKIERRKKSPCINSLRILDYWKNGWRVFLGKTGLHLNTALFVLCISMKKILSRVLWIQIREGKIKERNLYLSDTSRKMPFLPSFDNYTFIFEQSADPGTVQHCFYIFKNGSREFETTIHANDLFLKSTQVKTLAELQKKMLNEVIPEGIKTVHYGDKQVYVYFDFQSGFKVIFSVVVYQDLTINVYINGKHLSSKHFSHLMSGEKISDACTLCNILAFVKAESGNCSEHSLGVNAIIQELEQAVQDSTSLESTTTGRLLFLIEQLKLTLLSPCSRR